MYFDLIKFPIAHKNLKWEAKEAVLDVFGVPHLFLMIKLTGTKFPHRAQIPQVWIGKVHAQHVLIDEDGLTVRAYFDHLLTSMTGSIYFGLKGRPELEFKRFTPTRILKLDRSRLPENIVVPRHLQ